MRRIRVFTSMLAPAAALGLFVFAAPQALASPSAGQAKAVDEELIPGKPGQLVTDLKTTPVGPGVRLIAFERFDRLGWVRGQVLKVDLGNNAVTADLLFPGQISAAKPLSDIVRINGAIAGVNGDYFDMSGSKAPLGVQIKNGELLKGPVPAWTKAAGVGRDGLGRLAEVMLEGTVAWPGGEKPLSALNQSYIPYDGIGVYTPVWGTASRAGATEGAWAVTEILVRDGKVASISNQPGSGDIQEGSFLIVARDIATTWFYDLKVGDPVSVRYTPKTDAAVPFRFAVGGNAILLKDGQIQEFSDPNSEPRTAIGFSADGKTMFLVAVDGRQSGSRGMTMRELAEFLQGLGAANALHLDGGGSTTLVARKPGEQSAEVINNPSDGSERPVPNGIGVFAAAGSGKPAGLALAPVSDHPNARRVFPGLSRSLTVKGYDETYAPAAAVNIAWQAIPEDRGSIERNGVSSESGVFRGAKPGKAVVQAEAEGVTGALDVEVLGELARIETDTGKIGLVPGETGVFSVVGYDADGYAAPIEPRDVTLEYDRSVVDIAGTSRGAFRVTPKSEGSTVITVTVNGHKTFLPVAVGLETVPVSGFEDLSLWKPSSTRATAAMEAAPGERDQGLKIAYDFSQSTGTRTANVHPVAPFELPDRPSRIALKVKGAARGEWIAFTLRDAAGKYHNVYGPHVDWSGWRTVEVQIPNGIEYPVQLTTIGAIETNADKQYQGELVYDDLAVKVMPNIAAPERPAPSDDPLFVEKLEPQRWKFAVLNGGRLAGASPDGDGAERVRATLRKIAAAEPEFLVINGNFVNSANPDNFALAEKLLAEEIGNRFPVYYVPGDGEMAESGNLNNFLARFQKNRHTFDHKGTRFLLLDSSTGSFRTSDFQQLIEMKASLDDAAKNPAIKNVAVITHYPTRDPLPARNRQLSDRKEAGLLERWLAEFRQISGGKGAAYISGHPQTTHVERVDGVPYVVLGPSGKAYKSGDNDGVWGLFGIDPQSRQGAGWLQAENRPVSDLATL